MYIVCSYDGVKHPLINYGSAQAGDPPAPARPVPIQEEEGGESESGEEDFTPSTWDASRTPTRSLLKVSISGDGSKERPECSTYWKISNKFKAVHTFTLT